VNDSRLEKVLLSRTDYEVQPQVIYCCICGADTYDPCEHLLAYARGESMADKDIAQPVQVNDSSTPIKNPTNDFRKQGNTAQEAISNRVQQRKGITPSEK
jgi:hypothetical protein